MFKKKEAGFAVWKSVKDDEIKFFVATFIDMEQYEEVLAKQNWKEPFCRARGYWNTWQELKVMKEGLMGMLNVQPNALTDEQYKWFNDLILDIKYDIWNGEK